jgi:hypothetical protein
MSQRSSRIAERAGCQGGCVFSERETGRSGADNNHGRPRWTLKTRRGAGNVPECSCRMKPKKENHPIQPLRPMNTDPSGKSRLNSRPPLETKVAGRLSRTKPVRTMKSVEINQNTQKKQSIRWSTLLLLIAVLSSLSPVVKAGQQLVILKAIYSGGDNQRDVTSLVSTNERNGMVTLEVNNQIFGGDPAFGKVKTLTVQYRTALGDFTVAASEGDSLTLPSPKAILLMPSISDTANPASPTASRHLAPEGVYYLLQRVSAVTDAGIVGFPAGTRVERISESDGNLKVKAGEDEFEVEKSLLTNNLDVIKNAEQQLNKAIQAQEENEKLFAIVSQKPPRGSIGTPGVHILRVKGTVLQVLRDGILLSDWDNKTLEPYTDDGGIEHSGADGPMDQPIFIAGVGADLVDGSTFDGVIFPAGHFGYASTTGAEKTVFCYATTAQVAVQRLVKQ